MTARECSAVSGPLAHGRPGILIAPGRLVGVSMCEQWEFRYDHDDGRWYWCCFEDASITASPQSFASRTDCIADAIRHGYLALDPHRNARHEHA